MACCVVFVVHVHAYMQNTGVTQTLHLVAAGYGHSYHGVTDNKQTKSMASRSLWERRKKRFARGGGSMYSYNTTNQTLQWEYLHSASNMQGGMQGRNTWIWVTRRYGCNKRVRLSSILPSTSTRKQIKSKRADCLNEWEKRLCEKRMAKPSWSLRKADMLT